MSVAEQVSSVIVRFFNRPDIEITRDTTAANVPGWDSLAHATLVMEIERALGIEFDLEDIFAFENVGNMIDKAAELKVAANA